MNKIPLSFLNVTSENFEAFALKTFEHQYLHNPVYRSYCNLIGTPKSSVQSLEDLPYLPIEFFKSHKVTCGTLMAKNTFTSSGTTGATTSKHFVTDISLYDRSFLKTFNQFYGKVSDYCILALLPAYLERKGSSLIYMVDDLIKRSHHNKSGFYLYNHDELYETLQELEARGQKTILFGVSFALLDFVEKYTLNLKHTIVMDTGGMKGRRKELTREELHGALCKGFGVDAIHSEYGMTELLSQAYASAEGRFTCPPWMCVSMRDTTDPLGKSGNHRKTGGINIIDLANQNSCSFIATQDLGKLYDDGTFEVLGRFDTSDIRGCSLLLK